MTEHELDRLATLVALKMSANHQCRFSGEEAGELHALVNRIRKIKDNVVNAIIGTLVIGILAVAWLGAKASLRQ